MRIILVLAISLIACTKKNPDLCCIDEADCANVGLDEVKGCGDGLLCRGNQCIAEVCASSAECDADAPYCAFIPDGRCQMTCTEDAQCPGFGESAEQTLCEAGACVECRTSDECSGSSPTCDSGRCVACAQNDQCASGVCTDNGTCADEADVAYVSPTGATGGTCTATGPCKTIEFALGLNPPRPFVVVDSGTYMQSSTLLLSGSRRLIGRGPTRPILKRTTEGPIVTTGNGVIGLEFLDLAGATGAGFENDTAGNAVLCPPNNTTNIRIVESILRENAGDGLRGRRCTITALRSQFRDNGAAGLGVTDSTVTFDACTATENEFVGLSLDAGIFNVTNNVIARNERSGILLSLVTSADGKFEFNTIIDNGTNPSTDDGFACDGQGASMSNNIIVRNARQTSGTCSFPNSIIRDSDIADIMFVSPDVAPFDYHIQSGSIAIDAATITVIDHDFDGDPRPSSGADVGADEL